MGWGTDIFEVIDRNMNGVGERKKTRCVIWCVSIEEKTGKFSHICFLI